MPIVRRELDGIWPRIAEAIWGVSEAALVRCIGVPDVL
jgi:hypothetical protein